VVKGAVAATGEEEPEARRSAWWSWGGSSVSYSNIAFSVSSSGAGGSSEGNPGVTGRRQNTYP